MCVLLSLIFTINISLLLPRSVAEKALYTHYNYSLYVFIPSFCFPEFICVASWFCPFIWLVSVWLFYYSCLLRFTQVRITQTLIRWALATLSLSPACVPSYVWLCDSLGQWQWQCVCIIVHVFVWVCVCVCMWACLCVCVCVCVYCM